MRKCEVVSHILVGEVRVTVGIEAKDRQAFIVLCLQDRVGCQHITTQTRGALALVEKICRAIRRAEVPDPLPIRRR